MNALEISRWLWDFYLSATLLLGLVLLASLFAGQPARKMALSWATAGGLVLLAILCALPDWSQVHLLPPAPPEANVADAPPLVAPFIEPTLITVLEPEDAEPPAVQAIPQTVRIDWGVMAVYGFALGSDVTLLWLALGAWQVRRLYANAQPAPPEVVELFQELSPFRSIRIGVLNNLPVAVAVGLSRPVILLPQALLSDADREQLRSVLAHELAHIEHRDLWLLAVLRGLMLLLWPHPLFWVLRRQVRTDQEILADAADAEVTSRGQYAEQLVALARSVVEVRVPRLASSVGLWERQSQLTNRIKLLLDEKLTILRRCSRGWRVGSAMALTGLVLTLSLATLAPAEPQNAIEEVKSRPDSTATTAATDRQQYAELRKLAKPNIILGFCVDENDRPLEGVQVDLYTRRTDVGGRSAMKVASTVSDEQGKFFFDKVVDIKSEYPDGFPEKYFGPQDSKSYTLIGRKDGRVTRFGGRQLSFLAQLGGVHFWRMPLGQVLRGRVTDEEGQPVADSHVQFGPFSATIFPDLSTTTDKNGAFALTNLESYHAQQAKEQFERENKNWRPDPRVPSFIPWERTLTVSHPKFTTMHVAIDKIPGDIEITLEVGRVLTGRVFKHGEPPEPAADVEVAVRSYPNETRDYWQATRVRTDAKGIYHFDELEESKHVVYVYTPGWFAPPMNMEVQSGKINEVPDIVLTQGGRVRIHLIDDETGRPLKFTGPTSAFVVPQPQPHGWVLRYTATTIVVFSPDGIGEQQLPAGKYHFLVSVPENDGQEGFKDVVFSRIRDIDHLDRLPAYEVVEGGVRDIEVRMVREERAAQAEITGKIMDNNRRYVPITPSNERTIDRDAYENGVFVPESNVAPR